MSGSTWVSRYQKGKTKKVKTNLDLLEQEIVSGSGICWAICKSAPHADNHVNIPPLSFLQAGCPSWRPTNSVKALKATVTCFNHYSIGMYSTVHLSVTLQSKFWSTASRIWLFIDKCVAALPNFGAWKLQIWSLKVLEFCALNVLWTLLNFLWTTSSVFWVLFVFALAVHSLVSSSNCCDPLSHTSEPVLI